MGPAHFDPPASLDEARSNEPTAIAPQAETNPNVSSADDDAAEAMLALKNLEARRRKKALHKWGRIAAAVALVAGIGGFLVFWSSTQGTNEPETPETAIVELRDYKTTIQGTGALRAANSSMVTPEVDGIIEAVYVSEGQDVKTGDALFTIKNDDLEKAISDAQQQVQSAQRTVSDAYSSLDSIYAQMEQERAAYEKAKAQAEIDTKKAEEVYQAKYDEIIAPFQRLVADKQAIVAQCEAVLGEREANLAWWKDELDAAYRALEEAEGLPDSDPNKRTAILEAQARINTAKPKITLAEIDVEDALDALDGKKNAVGIRTGDTGARKDLADAEASLSDHEIEAIKAANEEYAKIPITQVPAYSEATYTAQIDSANKAISTAQEGLTTARRAYDKAVQSADKRIVKAATSGTVLSLSAKKGASTRSSLSSTSSSSLAEISDLTQMRVTLNVNEIDINTFRVGQQAEVTFSALPDVQLTAEVASIASVAPSSSDGTTGGGGVVTFPVELVIKKPDSRLKPGMTANVTVITQERPNALIVPTSALVEEGERTYLHVVVDEENMSYVRREVTTAEQNSVDTVIVTGATEGEVILMDSSLGVLVDVADVPADTTDVPADAAGVPADTTDEPAEVG